MNAERFHELLEAYIDGTLDDGASNELLTALRKDADLKAQFLEELRLLNCLKALPLLSEGDRRAEDTLQCILPGGISRDMSLAVLTALRPPSGRRRYPAVLAAAGIAAAIALGLFVTWTTHPADEPLATIAHQVDARWAGEKLFVVGEEVRNGHLRLESGMVRIDFAKGVRLTLEGPADLEILGPGETRLHKGKLTANVPTDGVGFQVHTERAKVVDLGTTFGVFVGLNGATDVAVFEGKVAVTSLASQEEKVIDEGDEVSLDANSPNLIPRKIRTHSFRGWPVLFGIVNTGGRIRFGYPQPNLNPADVTDSENIVIFPERFATKLRTDYAVSVTEPGDYGPEAILGQKAVMQPEKRRVNTYLLQYHPPQTKAAGQEGPKRFVGEVSFDRPIVAIIADGEQLAASDQALGKKRFAYPPGAERALRSGDHLSLSLDRRTLKLDWQVTPGSQNDLGQIRVIVDVSDPQSIR